MIGEHSKYHQRDERQLWVKSKIKGTKKKTNERHNIHPFVYGSEIGDFLNILD